jgi:hypothetical protein
MLLFSVLTTPSQISKEMVLKLKMKIAPELKA